MGTSSLDANVQNENYTKVTMDLNDYLTNGTSLITIIARGLRTKQELCCKLE